MVYDIVYSIWYTPVSMWFYNSENGTNSILLIKYRTMTNTKKKVKVYYPGDINENQLT